MLQVLHKEQMKLSQTRKPTGSFAFSNACVALQHIYKPAQKLIFKMTKQDVYIFFP